ncbi:hypothetical protein [Enhygromyxa salina]|uniref:HEAT repeat protein n=1 Tax=Enhygromyxa salina TaxID=215803 RepID=A0A2S9Y0B5_9BACT|nr:hypothetical protein [Enhygromyxa salina]PRP98568.1 hypothetical protein ENSA7_65110 [Enhygromyxa salina]
MMLPTPSKGATPEHKVLWDVVTEHWDAAGFAFDQWQDALHSPIYVLDEVARGPEAAWRTHLGAALFPGPAAFDRLLAPTLERPDESDPSLVCLAALVALRLDRRESLAPTLWESEDSAFFALARAVGLAANHQFDAWIDHAFGQTRAPLYRSRLLHLAAVRGVRLPGLSASLQSADPAEVVAASLAARWVDRNEYLPLLEHVVETGPTQAWVASVETALRWGSTRAFAACRRAASAQDTCNAAALRWLALLGDPSDHALIVPALDWQTVRRDAIQALGLSGNVAAIELLLPLLGPSDDDECEAQLTAEALARITGLDMHDETLQRDRVVLSDAQEAEAALPPLASDDLEGDLELGPEHVLPVLDPVAAGAWCERVAGRLDPRHRHTYGDADTAHTLVLHLRDGNMRDRHHFAASLAVRSGDRYRIHTDALSSDQLDQLAALEGWRASDINVRFSRW